MCRAAGSRPASAAVAASCRAQSSVRASGVSVRPAAVRAAPASSTRRSPSTSSSSSSGTTPGCCGLRQRIGHERAAVTAPSADEVSGVGQLADRLADGVAAHLVPAGELALGRQRLARARPRRAGSSAQGAPRCLRARCPRAAGGRRPGAPLAAAPRSWRRALLAAASRAELLRSAPLERGTGMIRGSRQPKLRSCAHDAGLRAVSRRRW